MFFHPLPADCQVEAHPTAVFKVLLKQRGDDVACDIRQPVIPLLESVCQLQVIEAEEVEDGGVEGVDVGGMGSRAAPGMPCSAATAHFLGRWSGPRPNLGNSIPNFRPKARFPCRFARPCFL